MSEPHPMFPEAITYSQLRVGLEFIVWDMAIEDVVIGGIITAARFLDSDDRRAEIMFVNSEGRSKQFNPEKFGVVPNYRGNWSKLITVPAEYNDRRDELPRIPKP